MKKQRTFTDAAKPAQLSAVPIQGDLFGTHVRAFYKNDEPLFVMKDVCDAIKITHYRNAIRRLEEDETCGVIVNTSMGPRTMQAVTESGVYHLIFMSRKPIAKAFRRRVTQEVLPALRRTGFYAMPGKEAADPLAFVGYTARQYLDNRGLALSASGVAHSCNTVCRKLGIEPKRRWSGTVFPDYVLDQAVRGRDNTATHGPARPERPDVFQFLTDRANPAS